jgi:hypothetical protein
MNHTEDRLRAALKMTGDQVPADGIPRLRLQPGRARPRMAGQRSRRWLAAAAAAIAVGLVIGLAAALAGAPRPARPVSPLAMPPYYVALQWLPGCTACAETGTRPHYQSDPDRAYVRATTTAKTVAVVSVPRPYGSFAAVAAAAGDRTFVLAAQKIVAYGKPVATRLYLLRISPSARPGSRAGLTPLAVPALPAADTLLSLSLSPAGDRVALLYRRGSGPESVQVDDLAAGSDRVWQLGRRFGVFSQLVWDNDDRTVLVAVTALRDPGQPVDFAWLDTSRPSGSFAADSMMEPLPQVPATRNLGLVQPAADGHHIIEFLLSKRTAGFSGELAVVDLVSGQSGILRQRIIDTGALWTGPAGQAIAISSGNGTNDATDWVLIGAHHLTPIPRPPDVIWAPGQLTAAW